MPKSLFIIAINILFFVQLNAQSSVFEAVERIKSESSTLKKANIFKAKTTVSSVARLQSNLKDGLVLEVNNDALSRLNSEKPNALEFEIDRGEKNKTLTLELVKYDVFTSDFKVKTDQTDNYILNNTGTHYRGIIKGEKESIVALSIFDDEVLSIINTPLEGDIILGKTQNGNNEYLLYKEKDVLETPNVACGTKDIPLTPAQIEGMKNIGQTANRVNNCVNVYFELDYTLFQEKGTVDASIEFIAGVYNAVATIYQNEEITTKISEVLVWTQEDPYDFPSSVEALEAFRNQRRNFNGDIAHLVSRGNPKSGGIAWVNSLCSGYAYAYSYVFNYFHDLPTYSWTVGVIAHEMGHTLGSPHTHACVWNGNNTPIDGCGPAAGANEGCDGPIPTNGGSIMSYCHLLSGVGINLLNGFGQQPGDLIRASVANARCLTSCEADNPEIICPTVSISTEDIKCFGGNDGMASITIDGGTAPFSVQWSNDDNRLNTNDLSAGNYSITVMDANQCSVEKEFSITQPNTALNLSFSGKNATSPNATDGNIIAQVTGGITPYDFKWSDNLTTTNLLTGSAGTYSLTVTDANGCTQSGQYAIEFDEIPCPTLFFSKMNVSCFGDDNGNATANVAGGQPPYQYNWSNGATTRMTIGLSAGDYSVTIVDANQCQISESITITQPERELSISGASTKASAPSENDGTIETIITGGNSPYSYKWSNQATTDFIVASEGIYTLTVTDANGCYSEAVFEIEAEEEVASSDCELENIQFPYYESFENRLAIFNQDGNDNIDWTPRAGKTPSRNTGPNAAFHGENYIYLEASRNYNKTAILNTKCLDLSSIERPVINFAYHMYGRHTGSLAFYLSDDLGETFTQIFRKTGNQGNRWHEIEIDLANYTGKTIQLKIEGITGRRYKSDIAIDNFYIGEKPGECIIPQINLERNNVTCNGSSDGGATIEVTNYTSGYSINWSNGQTSSSITDLAEGLYYVTVTVDKECFTETRVRIREPQSLEIKEYISNPSAGESNGRLEVYVMGGVPPYELNWSNGMTGDKITNLKAGEYALTAIDGNGCQIVTTYVLFENDESNCEDLAQLPFSEDFELGISDLVQSDEDEMDWIFGSSGTPSPQTGPSSAYQGGIYAYIEASGNTGNSSFLTTPCINMGGTISPNLSFAYSMYGVHTGTLSAEISTDMGLTWTEVWSLSGDQGSSWKKAFVDLSQYANQVIQVRLKGFVPGNYRSDIAIDAILIDDAGSTLPVARHSEGLLALKDMSVFPNAIFDWTTIEFETTESTEITISIVDVHGKPIREEKMQSIFGKNQIELDLGTLEGGNYFITITNGERVIAEKIVKVKW